MVQAQENLTTLSSLITLSRESGESITEDAIYEFLDYANQLEKSAQAAEVCFSSSQVGKTATN